MFQLIDRHIREASPAPGVGVMGGDFAADGAGRNLVRMYWLTSRDDTPDIAWLRHSNDGGKRWTDPQPWPTCFDRPLGTERRHHRGGYFDPLSQRYITFWNQGVLPNDMPMDGLTRWTVHYSVSEDNGLSDLFNQQVIHDGPDYDSNHHMPGVSVGRNAMMLGDLGQRPLTRSDGVILLPVQVTPIGPAGHYHNPGKGYTYTDCMILMGRWRADRRLAWTCSARLIGDPTRTTRGVIEPTLAELDDGRILTVMRGSNDVCPDWPAYKWHALSYDGGDTWSTPQPWTYDDGEPIFSPSSCSQLLRHSSGLLLWLGNVRPTNPHGNGPRYPIVVGTVNPRSGCLQRGSIYTIDDRREDESPRLALSNFYAREDYGSGDLLFYMSRFYAKQAQGQPVDYTAHSWCYRITVKQS